MSNFIKIEYGYERIIVRTDDIICVDFFKNINQEGRISFYLKGCRDVYISGDYKEMDDLFGKIEKSLSAVNDIIPAGEETQVSCSSTSTGIPKVAKTFPDLDKCVLITED